MEGSQGIVLLLPAKASQNTTCSAVQCSICAARGFKDAIDAQTRFLFRHGIDSTDQIDIYRACADEQLTQLYTERKALKNEQRHAGIPDKCLAEIRERIAAISEQAKLLRNELKLCDAITKRAFALSKRQEQVKQFQREKQDVGCHRHPSKTSLKIY